MTKQSNYLNFIENATALLLLIYPTCMLTLKGGMNGVFLLTLFLAFTTWGSRPSGINRIVWQPVWAPYIAAMLAMSTAILLSQIYFQDFTARPHDAASRFWLAIPIFLLLQRLRINVFAALQYAFPIAAIAGFPLAAIAGLLLTNDIGDNRAHISTLDPIHFGDFELILGVLSLFSINWFGHDRPALRILKLLGFAAGLGASFASGTRGGWLAIPVFIGIFIHFRAGTISPKKIATVSIATILTATLLYSFNTTLHQRMNKLAHDVTSLEQNHEDTSIGVRWQLYKAAANTFYRHPFFGVGPQGFALEMNPLLEAGEITPLAAKLGRGEVHNDLLSKAAGMGISGLIAMLAVYFIPLRLFWQASKSPSRFRRRTGILGVTFVSGFFVFGLTVEFLNLTMATAFYSFTIAVLLAACYNVHYDRTIVRREPHDASH